MIKKTLTFALCAATAFGAFAQKEAVDRASKMAGKLKDLTEARATIKGAMENPETANEARTYFVAGKIEFDAYDAAKNKLSVNPQDKDVDLSDLGNQLNSGLLYFLKAIPLDSVPNAKGQVKPKHIGDIVKKIAAHHNDYYTEGANYFNAQKYYPEAYESFMNYAEIPTLPFLGSHAPQVPDSARAVSYFNAGIAAYSGNEVLRAAKAFKLARVNGYHDPQCYIYEIASWQNLAQNDSTQEAAAAKAIRDVAEAGYRQFGIEQPLFINNLVNTMVTEENYDGAIALVGEEIAKNPENASLYGLRGFVYDRAGKSAESEADYRKAASLPTADFETLKNAAKKIFRLGQERWNLIEGNSEQARNERQIVKTEYFEAAKAITDRAKAMNSNDPDLDYVVENIDYALETYF